jgi:hypothetical protein
LALQKRTFNLYQETGKEYWLSADWSGEPNNVWHFSGTSEQQTLDAKTGWNRSGPNPGDVGCEFLSHKQSYSSNHSGWKITSHRSNSYEGPQFAFTGDIGPLSACWPDVTPSDFFTLGALGTTAIARCSPTNPAVDLAVSLGELATEGIPRMPATHTLRDMSLRSDDNIGAEYLNVEFGIEPLVRDIRALADVVVKSDKIMADYRAGSGKTTRRRYSFPTEVETEVTDLGARPPIPALLTYLYDNAFGSLKRTRTIQRDRWFSGAFTYYLSAGDGLEGKLAQAAESARRLYGIDLSLDTAWNLTPWSWAADWGSNIGDVIQNVSAFQHDGLVMRYGYMMEHTIATDLYELSGITYRDGNGPHTLFQSFTTEWKKRIAASPYGFGLLFDGFSDRQKAILGALAISRMH